MKKSIVLMAAAFWLLGAGCAFADGTVTVIPWSGSFFLDNRAVKNIDSQADLALIQPIVVKTRDTVVKATDPNTGLVRELERSSSTSDGTGLIKWRPTDSGTWKLSSSRDGSATFFVGWNVFHGGEDGTSAAKAYSFASKATFSDIVTNEAYGVSVGTYIRPDMNWLTLADLHDVLPDIDGTEVVFTAQGDGTYLISALGAGDTAPYYGVWGETASIVSIDTSTTAAGTKTTVDTPANIRIDTTDIHSAATPKVFTTTPENGTSTGNYLWPITFGANQAGSIAVLNPNSGATSYLTGRATRPDKSGEIVWEAPTDGGIYRLALGGEYAYFSFPVAAVSGDGASEATAYLVPTTNALATLTLNAGDYVQFTGSTGVKVMSESIIDSHLGFKTVDPDQKIYQVVNAGPTVPTYDIVRKFALSTTRSSDDTNTRAVDSLDKLLPVRYSGGNIWTSTSLRTATVATDYYAGFSEEGEATASESVELAGLGEIQFAPAAQGLYVLTHTSLGVTETARFTVGDAGTPVTETYEGDVASATAFTTAVNTIGYKNMTIGLTGDIVVAAADYDKGALTVPASVENITIDLKGQVFQGFDATVEHPTALNALVIKGTNTNVTVTDSVGGGILRGGNGLDDTELKAAKSGGRAISFPQGYAGTVTIVGATVQGGNGGSSTHAGDAANGIAGLGFEACCSGKVVVGAGATVHGGNGGSSTLANGGNGSSAIYVASMSPTSVDTEIGYLDIEVAATGKIIGGNGGNSANKTAGNGASAISVPLSDIVSGTLALEDGAVVKGGDAGDAGASGKAGTGGAAVSGTATVEGDEDAALASGDSGSYIVNSQEDIDLLVESYAAKADGDTLNIKLGDEVTGATDLEIDAKVEGLTVDLNGKTADTITVKGATNATITDTAETPGSVGQVTAGEGSSVDIDGAAVTTVSSDGGMVNVGEGSTVTTLEVENGGEAVVSGGTVGTVSATGGSDVKINDGTVATVGGDSSSTVVVAPTVVTPPAVENVATATYLTNDNKGTVVVDGAKLVLNGNITDLAIPAAVATLSIDMNGWTITGTSATEEGADGTSAITVASASTTLTITGEGVIAGGDGADGATAHGRGAVAISAPDGAVVTVAETVTVTDGADGFAADNLPTIKILKMQQRYPWNGYVDIDYTLTGSNFANISIELAFTNSDGDSQTAQKWIVAPTVEAGTHRMTWNAAAEFATGYVSKDVKVTVKLVRRVVVQ